MRYSLTLTLLFFSAVTAITCSAQSTFQKDSVIVNLQQNLPKGWVLQMHDSCIYIIRTKLVYRTLANHINGPAEFGKKKITTDDDTPPAGSVKDTMELVLKLSPRWSNEKYKEITRNNDHYYIESDKLHFGHKKGGTTFQPVGKDSSITIKGDPAIDKYNARLDSEEYKIDNQIIRPPELCTQLYFLDYVWLKKDIAPYPLSYDIFPEQANIELQKIRDYISDNCSCYRLYGH